MGSKKDKITFEPGLYILNRAKPKFKGSKKEEVTIQSIAQKMRVLTVVLTGVGDRLKTETCCFYL